MFKRKHKKSQVEKLEERMEENPNHVISLVAWELGVNLHWIYTDIQRTYEACLTDKDYDKMKLVRRITGIGPSEEVVYRIHNLYSDYALGHGSDKIVALMEASGVPMSKGVQISYLKKNLKTDFIPKNRVVNE